MPIFFVEVGPLEQKTLRTIGASVILVALVAAAIPQITASGSTTPVEIAVDSTSTTTNPDAHPTSPTAVIDEPFTYRLGLLSGITTDNFWAFYGEEPSVWNAYVLGPTKPALFTQAGSTGTLQAELAEQMTSPVFDENGWRIRVDLRSDLSWSDGTPVTARDFVFTFETVRRLDLGGSWAEAFPEVVESVHADSDHELRIEFTERPRLSVWPYGVGVAPIMAQHAWEDLTDVEDAGELYEMSGIGDVGGGPLTLDAVSETEIRSIANPGYSIAEAPDAVVYSVLGDESAAVAALEAGEIDGLLSPRGVGSGVLEDAVGIELVASPANAVRYLGFNLRRIPMADAEFRKAVALLLDREGLSAEIGAGPPAWSLVPEANVRWYDAGAVESITKPHRTKPAERLESAIEGLVAAGYAWEQPPSVSEQGEWLAGSGLTIDGIVPQPVTVLTPGEEYDPSRVDYVEEIADVLGVLGFDARPVVTDFDTVVDLVFTPGEGGAHEYDMYVLGWTLGDPALPRHYEALFGEGGVLNNTGYGSKRFASALEAYQGAFSHQDAKSALWEMEAILAQDLPYLPLYTTQIIEAYRSDRVEFDDTVGLGGWQARLGGIRDVQPAG